MTPKEDEEDDACEMLVPPIFSSSLLNSGAFLFLGAMSTLDSVFRHKGPSTNSHKVPQLSLVHANHPIRRDRDECYATITPHTASSPFLTDERVFRRFVSPSQHASLLLWLLLAFMLYLYIFNIE